MFARPVVTGERHLALALVGLRMFGYWKQVFLGVLYDAWRYCRVFWVGGNARRGIYNIYNLREAEIILRKIKGILTPVIFDFFQKYSISTIDK